MNRFHYIFEVVQAYYEVDPVEHVVMTCWDTHSSIPYDSHIQRITKQCLLQIIHKAPTNIRCKYGKYG